MRILNETTFPNKVYVIPGNSIHLIYCGQVVLEREITEEDCLGCRDRRMTITGAVIFMLEPGDIPGVEGGIGGAFIKEVE